MSIMHIRSADRSLIIAKFRMPAFWSCRNTTKTMEISFWQASEKIPHFVWFRPSEKNWNTRHGRKASSFWRFNSIISILCAASAEPKSAGKVRISNAKTAIAEADIWIWHRTLDRNAWIALRKIRKTNNGKVNDRVVVFMWWAIIASRIEVGNYKEGCIYMVRLSGWVPPAGVHEDPAKTVTFTKAARVLEVI